MLRLWSRFSKYSHGGPSEFEEVKTGQLLDTGMMERIRQWKEACTSSDSFHPMETGDQRQQVPYGFEDCFGTIIETYLRAGNIPRSPHRSPFDLLSNPIHPPYLLRAKPPPQLQCSSLVSLLPSWLLVSSMITARSSRRFLICLMVLAAASSLASPIPADSPSKKEIGVKLVREPTCIIRGAGLCT